MEKGKMMNKAKLWKSMVLTLALSLALGACSNSSGGGANGGTAGNDSSNPAANDTSTADGEANTDQTALPLLTALPYKLSGSEDGTADFLAANADYQSPYQNDTCLNITPSFMPADGGISVFKYTSSNETFVFYDGAVYAIGGDSSGDGVTSMAMADYTGDGAYELYYAYSNGSDSHVGCFDPAQKAASDLSGGKFSGQPVVLSAEGSTMTVCVATVTDYESLTSMTLEPGDQLATIVADGGKAKLEMNSETAG